MRKIASWFLLVLLTFTILCGFNFADAVESGTHVYDDADLLTDAEEAQIEEQIAQAIKKAKTDILVVTTADPSSDDYEDTAKKISDEWVAREGGYDKKGQTVVFYVDMKNRKLVVTEYNSDNKFRISVSERDNILAEVGPYLTAEQYYDAISTAVEEIRSAAKPGFFSTVWSWILMGLLGSGAATGIGVGNHKAAVRIGRRHYMKGKIKVGKNDEVYINTTTEVRKIEKSSNNNDNGHDGAGHSTGSASF